MNIKKIFSGHWVRLYGVVRRGTIFCARNGPEMKRSERNNAMTKMQTENPMRLNDATKHVGAQYFVPEMKTEISHKDVGKKSPNIIKMLNWINLLLCRTILTVL